jgi:protein-S-isoprenylcysteine O-methyltransferase Ste14
MSVWVPLESPLARLALLVLTLLCLGLGFGLRSWLNWRRSGINPWVLPAGDDAAGYVGRGFRLAMVMAVVVVLATAAGPPISAWLGGLSLPHASRLAAAGWVLLLAALLLLLVAQAQMGLSWRIGIDLVRPTALVTHGLFSWSRNPIFLAMRLLLLALVLLVPAAVALAVLAAAEVLIQVQVRLEEAHLTSQHGAGYARYRARVRRWFGRSGAPVESR